jgi:predicted  nucleic acid-binding Zn-ribbon protein
MSTSPITDLESAKAALDEEISTLEMCVRSTERDITEAEQRRAKWSSALYTLRDLRRRMEPPVPAELSVVEGGKDAA